MSTRPPFAEHYPKDAQLDRLVEAFARGNFARVRRDARDLAATTSNKAVRAAATDLRRRIEPSPFALYLLALGVLLLLFLYLRYLPR